MKYLQMVMLTIMAVFAPIQAILTTTAVLIGLDLVSGVVAAKKRGDKITSAGLRRTISKLVIYEVALMAGFLAEHYMIPDLPVAKLVSSLIAMVELKSIYENLDEIQGGNLLGSLIAKLGSENAKK